MQINDVIYNPIITEKSMADASLGRYHFKVNKKSSKGAIAASIEDLFDVDVVSVKTMVMPGKKKRVLRGFRYTKTANWKKAVVELKEGQKIKLIEEAK